MLIQLLIENGWHLQAQLVGAGAWMLEFRLTTDERGGSMSLDGVGLVVRARPPVLGVAGACGFRKQHFAERSLRMNKPVKLDRSAAIETAQNAVGLVVCVE